MSMHIYKRRVEATIMQTTLLHYKGKRLSIDRIMRRLLLLLFRILARVVVCVLTLTI